MSSTTAGTPTDDSDWLFTPPQQVAMFIAPILPSLLSLTSSLFVVRIILNDRKRKLRRAYHRIVFCLTWADIINSSQLAVSTIPIPRDVEGFFFGNFGTRTTCNMQGFLYVVGFAVPFLTMTLCLFYLLTVVFEVEEATFAKRWEPLLYGITTAIPILLGLIGLAAESINPMTRGSHCALGGFPQTCNLRRSDYECIRGGELPSVFFHMIGVMIGCIFAVVAVSTTAVYITVRKQENKMNRKYSFRGKRALKQRREEHRAHKVAIQAILYQGAFVICFFLPTFARFFHKQNFYLSFFAQLTYPLQGFWNAFIYLRPRYNVIRERNPELSFHDVFSLLSSPDVLLSGRSMRFPAKSSPNLDQAEPSKHSNRDESADGGPEDMGQYAAATTLPRGDGDCFSKIELDDESLIDNHETSSRTDETSKTGEPPSRSPPIDCPSFHTEGQGSEPEEVNSLSARLEKHQKPRQASLLLEDLELHSSVESMNIGRGINATATDANDDVSSEDKSELVDQGGWDDSSKFLGCVDVDFNTGNASLWKSRRRLDSVRKRADFSLSLDSQFPSTKKSIRDRLGRMTKSMGDLES